MSHVIGHGRYARETYPQNPATGISPLLSVPLSRQRFIDGDTSNPGPGAASAPFKTIAAFMASRLADTVSVEESSANYVGWLTPAVAGYPETITFPANVSTELRAPSLTSPGTTIPVGPVTWDNATAGAFQATNPTVALHNIFLKGVFTVTDDGSGHPSFVVFGGDEAGIGSSAIEVSSGDAFNASVTSVFAGVVFFNTTLQGNIDVGNSAIANLLNTDCNGNITCGELVCSGCALTSGTITAATIAVFDNTTFAFATVLTAPSALFDGVSWMSFVGAGGDRGTTPVLVVGGYSGGAVEGGAIANGVTTSVSLDGSGSPTIPAGGNHYSTAANIGAATSVTLFTGGALPGDTILISKSDLGAGVLTVLASDGLTVIGQIPTLSRGFVLARFDVDTSDWVFAEGGSLLA